ncbi:MAG: hypothetical protein RL145_93 [Pseudomonadota bacterium]|jgi:NADH:ubiquinone oxidoreductase subunit C
MSALADLQERLTSALGASVLSATQANGELTLVVRRDDILAVLQHYATLKAFLPSSMCAVQTIQSGLSALK